MLVDNPLGHEGAEGVFTSVNSVPGVFLTACFLIADVGDGSVTVEYCMEFWIRKGIPPPIIHDEVWRAYILLRFLGEYLLYLTPESEVAWTVCKVGESWGGGDGNARIKVDVGNWCDERMVVAEFAVGINRLAMLIALSNLIHF